MLGPILMLGYFILPQFTSAGTSVAAQYLGARRHDRVAPTWVANILISTAIGAVLGLVLFAFSGKVGSWLGMTAAQNAFAADYLSVIAFNFILVGVRGIALATVISYFLGFAILFYMVHARLKVKLLVKGLSAKAREVVLPILKIGIPAALEPFSYTVQSFVVSVLIIDLGAVAMGANTYVNRFNFLDMAVSWSLTMGGQIAMSHHLGAGRIGEVKKTYWKIASITMSFAFAIFLVITLFDAYFLSFFTKDEEIVKTCFWLLVISLFMEPIRSINILGGVALKTVGDGKFSVILGLVFMWGLVPLIILSSVLHLGIVGLWCCLLLDETIRAGINAWRWKSGRWMGKSVIGEAPKEPAR